MNSNFKFISHPADTGIEVEAENLEELFMLALKGFYATIFEKPEMVEISEEKIIEAKGEDIKELLVNFLTECLILLDSERFIAKEVKFVKIPEVGDADLRPLQKSNLILEAKLKGGMVDLNKLGFITEIKAITYHQLGVEKRDDKWFARVVFDI